jgi:hypothetical protein
MELVWYLAPLMFCYNTSYFRTINMLLAGHYWKREPANISSMAADRQTHLEERCVEGTWMTKLFGKYAKSLNRNSKS